ncbi:MAG: RagB/SusD family nutrient uptake outer membrane protein [Bacteroides sp.]|nr:RagB/SusD family nutrient uptake outer membrane protein [Bacteroides sp.]
MKTIINKLFLLVTITFSLAACSDFLEKEPLSSGTEAIVFKTPEHFVQAANALYNVEGWKNYNGAAAYDNMDRGLDISGLSSNGGGGAPDTNWQWNKPYEYIRGCNILLQKADEYSGDPSEISHSVGTAYFFRAWQHFYLLKRFGGVPIVEHVVDVADEVLYGPRNSRYEVAAFIMSDLEKAIPLLTQEKNISDSDKGKVSKEAAKSFLARVLLYEATWEKYVPEYPITWMVTELRRGQALPGRKVIRLLPKC